MPKIEYRTESAYGSGVRELDKILEYEILELGNTSEIQDLIHAGLIDIKNLNIDINDPDAGIGKILADEIIQATGKPLKYALWLTDIESVKKLYGGDDTNIDAYETSKFVLIDLGPDGRLYAYETLPKKL